MDNFLLQAYLNREMDPQTEADFEIELIRNPELAELAFADSALLAGLAELELEPAAATGQLAEIDASQLNATQADAIEADATQKHSNDTQVRHFAAEVRTNPATFASADNTVSAAIAPDRGRARRSRSYKWLPLACAASVSALCAGFVGYALRKPQIYGGAQLVYIDKQRSLSSTIEIPLPKSGPLLLLVPVASTGPCVADIRLSQGSQIQNVQATPDEFGFASVILSGDALKPGPVSISIKCDGLVVGGFDAQVVSR